MRSWVVKLSNHIDPRGRIGAMVVSGNFHAAVWCPISEAERSDIFGSWSCAENNVGLWYVFGYRGNLGNQCDYSKTISRASLKMHY